MAVFTTMKSEAASDALFTALGVTLARVATAFLHAMAIGSAIGYVMGRNALFDRAADPWVIVLLNLPALVIIVPAYIWAGLNEAAAIRAVALNKLPVTVTIREGVRALYARLDEMARVFCFSRPKRLAHVVAPQLAPYFAAATRAGLSLVWKIVLVVELIGRQDAVLERLMPALDLALGLRVIRGTADMLDRLAIQPLREIRRDVRRAVIRQQTRSVNDGHLVEPRRE
jgi:NitT/TauT family transport system permease protein